MDIDRSWTGGQVLRQRRRIKEIRAIGWAGRPRAAQLAVSCVVGVLAVFVPSAGAAGTVYVANLYSESVTAFSIASDGRLSPVPGSPSSAAVPLGVAVTPDGKYLYVADFTISGGVSAFSIAADGALSAVAGSPFRAEPGAWGVAIAPDGKHLYVANDSGNVSAYSIASNGSLTSVPGSPFAAGSAPTNLAITPNGRYLYVTNQDSNNLSAFSIASDGALSPVSGSPYPAGGNPRAVSLTPDGRYLYVADQSAPEIAAFSIAADGTLTVVPGSPFASSAGALGISVSPDGKHLYTSSSVNDSQGEEPLSAFSIAEDGALTAIAGSPFSSGGFHANSVTVSPDSQYVYVSNYGPFEEAGDGTVSALSIAPDGGLKAVLGSPFTAGEKPVELTVTPDEGSEAAFTPTPAPAGDPTTFDATASSDSDYPLASYRWEFGDGQTETTSSATTTHTYATSGAYTATLTVTDAAGCSTAQIFTGQTVSCNGSSQAEISHQVMVPVGVSLDVARTGSGSGTVTSAPSGVECGRMCSYAFEEGEKVKLTENPEPGSTFASWSGACSGREATCEVMMSEAKEVKAAFNALPTFLLSVERTGTGVGIVTSEPSGIECEATCSHTFWEGEKVKLNEKPQAGSTFAGWSGGGCSGTGTCQVTTNVDTNITATFSKASSTVALLNETPLSSIPQQTLPLLHNEASSSPSVQNARQSVRKWREGNQLAHISRSKMPIGTTFSFSLNEQAIVSFSFVQLVGRHSVAYSCLAKTHKNVKGAICDIATMGTLSFTGHSGTNNVIFAGRISHARKLKPGEYELTITATNSSGQRSTPVSLTFTIVK